MEDDAKIALQRILDEMRELQEKKRGTPVIINLVLVLDAKGLAADEHLLKQVQQQLKKPSS